MSAEEITNAIMALKNAEECQLRAPDTLSAVTNMGCGSTLKPARYLNQKNKQQGEQHEYDSNRNPRGFQ